MATGGYQNTSADTFKVAMLLPGSVNDYGYNAMGKRALDMIRAQLGVETSYTESVPVPNQLDVYRQYAAQGYKLIIGWGGQFTDGAVQAAEEFPKTDFLIVNGTDYNGRNLGSLDTKVHEWEFVGGYLMGKLSKSGIIGFVGGMCFPATVKNLDGIEQGAKKANPRIKVLHTWTGSFEDPIKAKQAAQSMIEQGADYITGNLNNGWFGIFRAAKEAGNVGVVTEWIDNTYLAPDVIVSSILKDQSPFVLDFTKNAIGGKFPARFRLYGLPKDWGHAVLKTDKIPSSIYKETIDIQNEVAEGSIKITTGECR
jgi:basic membrane protein A